MKINLDAKIILLTGGTSDIGIEIARTLSNAGATIAVHYNKNQDKAERLKK